MEYAKKTYSFFISLFQFLFPICGLLTENIKFDKKKSEIPPTKLSFEAEAGSDWWKMHFFIE